MIGETTKPMRATTLAPNLSESVPARPPNREGSVIAMKMAPLAKAPAHGLFNAKGSHLLATKDGIKAFPTESWPVSSCLKFFLLSTTLSVKKIFSIACHAGGNMSLSIGPPGLVQHVFKPAVVRKPPTHK